MFEAIHSEVRNAYQDSPHHAIIPDDNKTADQGLRLTDQDPLLVPVTLTPNRRSDARLGGILCDIN